MDEPNKPVVRDLIYGGIGALLVASLAWLGNVIDTARFDIVMLQQIHEREWPQELAQISFRQSLMEAQAAANERKIEELEREVRSLR